MTRYTVLIDSEAGGYGVVFPDLPGCAAMGTTIDGALANAADALRDWIEVTLEEGGTAPIRPDVCDWKWRQPSSPGPSTCGAAPP